MAPIITSVHHPLIKHCLHLRLNSDFRDNDHSILLEGVKPIYEVKEFVLRVFYTQAYREMAFNLPGEKWEVTESIIDKISGVKTPEGLIAEVKMPSFVSPRGMKRVMVLDAINDPGNMGTLLRTALALGWDAAFFLPSCCDPFNEKVLRAARGAHFKLKLMRGTEKELFDWVLEERVQPLFADIQGVSPQTISSVPKRLLILGNEAHGVSDSVRAKAQAVSIPMSKDMESLNVAVAGGILLYLLNQP